ncbi:hypothetical protein BCR37DRAFT_416042 [Protomyces lactucae-debilis]|uniref:Uncharacterized protein n=1 Tax=Protomyces lactucae-debilis TaxID=2754530 RepID=A0A1Y2EQ41_PROLT|nr:uncharacterized protein BCR37DRAFT_416042 [Protomyces lactucae-debilis]ORY73657.1 hypothetical protein BCR37DRAFT_416042 [Protomyces lactucae-debilis]
MIPKMFKLRPISTMVATAQLFNLLLQSVFLAGLFYNHGILSVSAKDCKAFWLTLKDTTNGYDYKDTHCQYVLKSGKGVNVPQTIHNVDEGICFYVPEDENCPHGGEHGEENWFREHRPNNGQGSFGIFCSPRNLLDQPEKLPTNLDKDISVYWQLTGDRFCPARIFSHK